MRLSCCELLDILAFFNGYDRSLVHHLVTLLRSQSSKIGQQDLVLFQNEHPVEKLFDKYISIVAVVIFDPFSHKL